MCFKLLFLIAFQIMRCACRKPLSVWLLFLCSSGHVCHSEEEQIQKNVNVDDLMPVPNLHFFIFSLFPTSSFSRSCCLFFLIFYLLVLSGHFSLFWPFKKWRPVVAELMRFGAEVEKVNFKVWGWHSSVLYVSYCQQITWRPKQKKTILFRLWMCSDFCGIWVQAHFTEDKNL